MDIECDAGCGLVPFRYRDKNFVNALQWAIGLELFLLVDDPWRVFLTTDHPNGGPFASYPQLVRLLMERSYREDCLAQINASARKLSVLGGIAREYTLSEIAVMTRAAPARSLGLADRGHLAPGAAGGSGDLSAEHPISRRCSERRFRSSRTASRWRATARSARCRSGATQVVRPGYDKQIERSLRRFFDDHMTMSFGNFPLCDGEIAEAGGRLEEHSCAAAGGAHMILDGVEIEDTFAEAFGMRATRLLITADSDRWARIAGETATGFATSVIACGAEAAIERDLPPAETPDGRPGVGILIFAMNRRGACQGRCATASANAC